MRKTIKTIWLLPLLLAACGKVVMNGNDLTVDLSWYSGSLPAPYAHSYVVKLSPDGSGLLEYYPGCSDSTSQDWAAPFSVESGQIDTLFNSLKELGAFRPESEWKTSEELTDGGPGSRLTVTAGDRKYNIPDLTEAHPDDYAAVEKAIEAVRLVVPRELWDEMNMRQLEYEEICSE